MLSGNSTRVVGIGLIRRMGWMMWWSFECECHGKFSWEAGQFGRYGYVLELAIGVFLLPISFLDFD